MGPDDRHTDGIDDDTEIPFHKSETKKPNTS